MIMAQQDKHKDDDARYDIFISYAHLDNYVSKGEGWVTMFHKALEIRAAQLLGEDVRIWRDDTLQMNEDFGAEIKKVLENSRVFVSVLTPRYLKSAWCNDELNTFVAKHENGASAQDLGTSTRLFKVVKTPVDQSKEPPPFHKVIGINFYKKGTIPPQELIPAYGYENAVDEGRQAMDRLAYAIQKLLKEIRNGGSGIQQASRGSIYLAATASDLEERRKKLVSELEDRGYMVLPKVDFPTAVSEIQILMQQDLQEALCSVHMVGGKYGFIPEDTDRSVVEIQIDEAFSYSKKHSGFSQFIWLSEEDEGYEGKLAELRKKASYLEFDEGRGDVIQNSFESFKAVMEEKLEALHDAEAEPEDDDHQDVTKSIYLIHTREDRKDIKGMFHCFRDKGFEVLWPVFDGKEENVAKTNREQLQKADGVLIFWGAGSEAWFIKNRNDVRDVFTHKGKERLKSVGVVLAAPKNDDKEFFLEVEDDKSCLAKVIPSFGEFSPDLLNEFLAPLLEKEEGRHD